MTVANHASTLDDPAVIAVLLPWDIVVRPRLMRWSVCSQEICFETRAIASFFGAGKVCVCLGVFVLSISGANRLINEQPSVPTAKYHVCVCVFVCLFFIQCIALTVLTGEMHDDKRSRPWEAP